MPEEQEPELTEEQRLRRELHDLRNKHQIAVGTLWHNFCAEGPLDEDAFDEAGIEEMVRVVAEAFNNGDLTPDQTVDAERTVYEYRAGDGSKGDVTDEAEQAAREYIEQHRHHPAVEAILNLAAKALAPLFSGE